VGFLQDIDNWIFLPVKMEVSISTDAMNFIKVGEIVNTEPQSRPDVFAKEFAVINPEGEHTMARYIKITAVNVGVCPAGHPGAGKKAWLFADEINIK
jgi:hexosaminidase